MSLGCKESEIVEFKEVISDSVLKTIIAFANGEGGTIYIGIDDLGHAIGLDDIDNQLLKLTSMMKDSIRPDLLMLVKTTIEHIESKEILKVTVQKGPQRPYYLAAKGLRPEGVYIRSGSASVPSSNTAIRQMLQDAAQLSFEETPSPIQDLSFYFAAEYFASHGLNLGDNEMRTLGLIHEGVFSNLGRIISDQCPTFVKVATFADDKRNTFLERKEFSGSILKQLEEAYAFISDRNRFKTSYDGLQRIDYLDYPEIALREALVNAVAHREYSLSGPTLVSIMPSHIEVTSLGGLPRGIVFEDLQANISMPRNKRFASLLYRLEIIEAWGTGIGRMREAYESALNGISLSTTPNTFTVRLANRNAESDKSDNAFSEEEDVIIQAIKNGAKTRRDIQEEVGFSQTKTLQILESLIARQVILRKGNTRSVRYILPK